MVCAGDDSFKNAAFWPSKDDDFVLADGYIGEKSASKGVGKDTQCSKARLIIAQEKASIAIGHDVMRHTNVYAP